MKYWKCRCLQDQFPYYIIVLQKLNKCKQCVLQKLYNRKTMVIGGYITMEKLVAMGIDHGNGYVKGRSELVKSLVKPSIFSKEAEFRGDNFSKNTKREIKFYHSKTNTNKNIFAWGNDVSKASRVISSSKKENRYSSEGFRLLTDFSLGELTGGQSNVDVIVVTGCPSDEINHTSKLKDLKESFQGSHLVVIEEDANQNTVVVNVKEVHIYEQPLGTLFYLYLDDEGFVRDDSYESSTVGIIDIGSGTTDGSIINEMNVADKYTTTLPRGMFSIYDELAGFINDKIEKTDFIKREVVEEHFRKSTSDKERKYFFVSKIIGSVDIEEKTHELFKELSDEIKNHFFEKWNDLRIDEILITGGGATSILKDYILKWGTPVTFVDEPQKANAEGFYRFAKYLKNNSNE